MARARRRSQAQSASRRFSCDPRRALCPEVRPDNKADVVGPSLDATTGCGAFSPARARRSSDPPVLVM
jgi:hypothetical protein